MPHKVAPRVELVARRSGEARELLGRGHGCHEQDAVAQCRVHELNVPERPLHARAQLGHLRAQQLRVRLRVAQRHLQVIRRVLRGHRTGATQMGREEPLVEQRECRSQTSC